MTIKPILTEKSMSQAKNKLYTFFVDRESDKNDIKKLIKEIYAVDVTKIRTINVRGGARKNARGVKIRIPDRKKALVTLKTDQKIDIFEEKK